MEELTLPATAASARTARRFVSAFCEQTRLHEDVCHDAILLVQELTGNSLRHARSGARISVDLTGAVRRVEVADDNPELPQLLSACPRTRRTCLVGRTGAGRRCQRCAAGSGRPAGDRCWRNRRPPGPP